MSARLTFRKVYDIAKILEDQALAQFNRRIAVYKPGWDDEKVAKKAGANFCQVRRVRARIFGQIRISKNSTARDRIMLLEAQDRKSTRLNSSH